MIDYNEKYLLVDIDHTLSYAFPRDHMIGNKSWDEYHTLSDQDEPIEEVVQLVNSLSADGWKVVGVTSRPEKFLALTAKWLIRFDIIMDELLMRPNDDHRPAADVKISLIKKYFGRAVPPITIMIDDNEKIIEEMRRYDITVMQVFARKR